MGLNIQLISVDGYVMFNKDITHNLAPMAKEANIYNELWHPEKLGFVTAYNLIKPLQTAYKLINDNPERFMNFNPVKGAGSYRGFVNHIKEYLKACETYPFSTIKVYRE